MTPAQHAHAIGVRSRLYGTPIGERAPLRVALVVPARVPAWLALFLAGMAGREWIGLDVVLVDSKVPAAAWRLPPDLRAYLAIERLRRRHSRADMLARVDVRACAQQHGLAPVAGPQDRARLRADLERLAPDLILLHGDRDLAAAVADCAPSGCWWIGGELSDPRSAALGLLAPMLDEDPATAIDLQLVFRAPDQVIALGGGNSATQAGSFGLQREQALHKLPILLLRGLREVHGGIIALPRGRLADLHLDDRGRRFAFGAGLRAFDVSLRNTLRWWRRIWKGGDAWFLAVRRAALPLDPALPEVGAVAALVAPAGRYWADPCIIRTEGGRRLLFAEEYGYRDSRGVIVCLELCADGSARRLGIALEESWHLSYPQVFEHAGTWYLTAESGAAQRACLYRAAGFPLCWERIGDLLSGRLCVDPTLHHHEGRWYLFANVSEGGGGDTCDELFLFVAEALAGPYLPHPLNPVVRDVRRSRPAGRLFTDHGRLIRPAQDCAPDYGAAIVFNEVLELSPTRYRERELARLPPSWMPGLWGCHTYSAIAGTEVIDARGHPAAGAPTVPVMHAPAVRDITTRLPIVTALVPVYNGERFLAEAIDSALAQTLRSVEIVVVDDGSTDASAAIADRYAALHPDRVRVVHQPNQGLPLARNAAIAAARGRYLALLDADDVWMPGHLAACVDVLERDPMIGLVHADAEDIDADGNPLPADDAPARWGSDSRDAYAAILLRRQHVVCPTAVFRRSVIENIGGFDPGFNRLGCEDRDLWLRIAEVAGVVYVAQLHARYRIHDANMSANSGRMWRARKLLVDKYAQRPRGRPLRRRARAAIDADLGHELARAPEPMPALAAFGRALLRDPLRVDAWKGLLRRVLVGRRPGLVIHR